VCSPLKLTVSAITYLKISCDFVEEQERNNRMKVRHLLIGVTVLFIVSLLATSSYAKLDLKTCIGMWLFDEGEGDITADSSGSKNDATLMNGPKWVDGKFGKGVSFDGVDDFVGLASQPDITKGFTFSAWVKRNAETPSCQEIFNNHRFFLRTQPEGEAATNPFETFVNLADGTVEPRASSGVASTVKQWFFIAVTWDKTTLKIYVDGEFKGQSTRTGTLATPVNAQIGRGEQKDLNANPFNGIIDDVAFFSVVLEAGDIKTLMDQGLKESLGLAAVDLSGKLTTTWAGVKTR